MDPPAAKSYLRSLLNRSLHIYTTDNRLFVGDFKCTDNVNPPSPFPFSSPLKHLPHLTFSNTLQDLNIILACTHEYRLPPPPSASDFLTPILPPPPISSPQPTSPNPNTSSPPPPKLNHTLTPRFVGLIVVPGAHVTRIEIEGDGPWVENEVKREGGEG